MRYKQTYTIGLLCTICCTTIGMSQETPAFMINEGIMVVSADDLVSIEGTFENTTIGEVINDGTMVYFHDFINNGYYGLSRTKTTSMAIFLNNNADRLKHISGNELSTFYNIQFNSPTKGRAFDLKNNIDVWGTADFQDGIVKVDSVVNTETNLSFGMFSFQQGAKAVNATDYAHVEGEVEKIGQEPFVYPIGDQGHYRPAKISAPKHVKDGFVSKYIYGDHAFFRAHDTKAKQIEILNDKEYWIVEKGTRTTSDILLTLSWDERTTVSSLLENTQAELHIVRWDETAKSWVDEGGAIDREAKEVSTIAAVNGYGYFTLALIGPGKELDSEDVVIYNLVTPNNDGSSDYFIIDNIWNYPNNKVEIYNRWGVRVYSTTAYDPNGDGSSNVFNGYSNGRNTIGKNNKLPSGTYYYVVTYEYKDGSGSRMIKKAANLHLENN